MVLGRLPDEHRDAGHLGFPVAIPARAEEVRDSLDAASQAAPGQGGARAVTPHRGDRGRQRLHRWHRCRSTWRWWLVRDAARALPRVHRVMSNFKTWLRDTYRGPPDAGLPRRVCLPVQPPAHAHGCLSDPARPGKPSSINYLASTTYEEVRDPSLASRS